MRHGGPGAHARRPRLAGEGGLLVRAIGGAGLDRITGPRLFLPVGSTGGGQGHGGNGDGEDEQAHGKPLESDERRTAAPA